MRKKLAILLSKRKKTPSHFRLRIRMTDRILLVRRLSLYLRAGIPIIEALDLIHDDAHGNQRQFLYIVRNDVRHGASLSYSLRQFPRVYKPFHIQMIAMGETSGTLSDSLRHVAELLTKRAQLSRSLISAFIYPVLIGVGTLLLSGLLIGYVFPKLTPLFRGLHTTLPFTTRVLISISWVLQHKYLEILILSVLTILATRYSFRLRHVRNIFDQSMFRLPLIGPLTKAYFLAHIFHSLSLLLRSGVRLDASLSLIRKSISNKRYSESLLVVEEKIMTGIKMTETLRTFPDLYPLTAIQLIAAGEMTGTLSESAHSVSELYEEALREHLQTVTILIEPALMLSMGFIVGFVALAIISPMYALTQNLSTH
jgi:type II secretory pathway component PulF